MANYFLFLSYWAFAAFSALTSSAVFSPQATRKMQVISKKINVVFILFSLSAIPGAKFPLLAGIHQMLINHIAFWRIGIDQPNQNLLRHHRVVPTILAYVNRPPAHLREPPRSEEHTSELQSRQYL